MTKLSTVVAATPAVDLAVVQAMADELERYLTGDEVYRTLVISTDQGEERLQSSGGDLLARLHKLEAQREDLSAEQRHRLDNLRRQIDQTLRDMKSPYHALLVREARARLNSLRWYLDESDQDRRQARVNYPFEMRNRQRLQEIRHALGEGAPEEIVRGLATVDSRIRSLVAPADFVWDEAVRDVYPRDDYWYLYVRPGGAG